jgi:hypothetical protein
MFSIIVKFQLVDVRAINISKEQRAVSQKIENQLYVECMLYN